MSSSNVPRDHLNCCLSSISFDKDAGNPGHESGFLGYRQISSHAAYNLCDAAVEAYLLQDPHCCPPMELSAARLKVQGLPPMAFRTVAVTVHTHHHRAIKNIRLLSGSASAIMVSRTFFIGLHNLYKSNFRIFKIGKNFIQKFRDRLEIHDPDPAQRKSPRWPTSVHY